MNKQLKDAINNITIIVRAAHMSADEHDQLKNDINRIVQELNLKEPEAN